MEEQITVSIKDLTGSVQSMTSTLNQSLQAIHSRVGDVAEMNRQNNDELIKETSERTAWEKAAFSEREGREKEALKMLDNIQHGRKPIL